MAFLSKYDALGDYLRACVGRRRVHLTFREIEQIIGDALPPSAREHREWWGNEVGPAARHSQCRAWMEAGWLVNEVDRNAGVVVFEEQR